MKAALFTSAIALGLATVASATKCYTHEEAEDFVSQFEGILNHKGSTYGNATATAEALLADEFVEYSNSILSIEGLPLGGPFATTKEEYIEGIPRGYDRGIETLSVYVGNCTNIFWQWNFNFVGSGKYPVKGFNRFNMTQQGQVTELYLEFDSIAWALNKGFGLTYPNGTHIGKQ